MYWLQSFSTLFSKAYVTYDLTLEFASKLMEKRRKQHEASMYESRKLAFSIRCYFKFSNFFGILDKLFKNIQCFFGLK
jgi:hypothetical protein